MNKYVAEFIGTLALATIVGLSVAGEFAITTPILAALTLGLFVYTVGHISGAHINPAVALALGAFNPVYVLAPIIGSILGFQVYKFVNERS